MNEFFDAIGILDANLGVWKLLLRLVLATGAGFLFGLESRSRSKDAGIKTHTILALTSCVLMIISKYGFYEISKFEGVQYDSSRVASTIVSGLCFLGAAMVFYKQDSVKGLTTAVGLCFTISVGMCFGSGLLVTGAFITIFTLILQILLHRVKSNKHIVVKARFLIDDNYLVKFKEIFGIKHFLNCKVYKDGEREIAEVEFYYDCKVSSEELVEIAKNEKQIIMLEKY